MSSNVEKKANEVDALLEEVEIPASTFERKPIEPPPEPAPKKSKGNGKRNSQKSIPPKLSKILPDAEKCQIWKRELGKRTHVNDYTARDLQHAPTIESFIKQYVMPSAGEGDYDVDLLNAKGELVRSIPISVMDPNKPPPGFSPKEKYEGDMMKSVLDRTLDKLDRLEAEARKPPPSFVDRMKEMAEIRAMLAPADEDGKKRGDDSSAMQMMMMMMMMDKQEKPAVSPELAELRAELRAMKDAPSRESLPPPLPPPPPPPDTTAADIVREIVALTQKKEDTSIKDIIPLIKPEKTVGPNEIVSMVTALAPILMQMFGSKHDDQIQYLKDQLADLKRTPSRGIKEALEDVGAMVSLAGKLGGRRDESETFWGFMNNLITQGPDLADSIGSVVNRIRQDEEDKKQLGPPKEEEKKQPEEEKQEALEFPPGFESVVKKIAEAEDDAGRVGATLHAFQVLGRQPEWRKYLIRVVSLAKKGDRDEVMEFLVSFLEALYEREMLTEEAAKAAIKAFEDNFDRVVEELAKKTKS